MDEFCRGALQPGGSVAFEKAPPKILEIEAKIAALEARIADHERRISEIQPRSPQGE